MGDARKYVSVATLARIESGMERFTDMLDAYRVLHGELELHPQLKSDLFWYEELGSYEYLYGSPPPLKECSNRLCNNTFMVTSGGTSSADPRVKYCSGVCKKLAKDRRGAARAASKPIKD